MSRPGIAWTPELEGRLKDLATHSAHSYAEIARLLSLEFSTRLTKNACIGRARRAGVPPRPKPLAFQVDRRKARPLPRKREPKFGTLEIFDLHQGACKWPFGERPPFKFCGKPQYNGCSYCEEHWREAVPPSRKS